MIISKLEKLVRRIPVAGDLYLERYCQVRKAAFKLNQIVPLLKFPRYVHFLVTYECNLNCKQCQVSAGERNIDQLSFREVIDIINQIKRVGINRLIITGGEPLVRKDIFEILHYANDVGIPAITLATNGYLVDKFKSELSKIRIDKIVTSIDGVGEWNDRIRGKKGAFERALRALDVFKEIGVKDREVNTTVFPGQVSQMNRLADHITSSSATRWVMGMLIPVGRATAFDDKYFKDEEVLALIDLIRELRSYFPAELLSHTGHLKKYYKEVTSEPFCCRAGWEACSITPDGEVVPCNMVSDAIFSQGNLRKKDFKTIWDEGFKELRNPKLPGECQNCTFLNECFGGCWAYRTLDAPYCYKGFC